MNAGGGLLHGNDSRLGWIIPGESSTGGQFTATTLRDTANSRISQILLIFCLLISFLCATSKLGRWTVLEGRVEGRALESERGHSINKYSAHNTSTTVVSERGDAANQRRPPQLVLVGRKLKTGRAGGRSEQRAFPSAICTALWSSSGGSRT